MGSDIEGNQGESMMKKSIVRVMTSALLVIGLSGCASQGMYTGGENLASRTAVGALVGTAIGGLTASSNDVRGGLRSGAAIGAASGLIFGAGENYQASKQRNEQRKRSYYNSNSSNYRYKYKRR
jgi:outer membrane lipoprotein SlyB